MLAKRIIPCLDVDRGRVVKGKKFEGIKDVDDPIKLAKRYSDEGADELVFYDITASSDEREIFIDTVRNISHNITIPFTVGGGVKEVNDFRRLLLAGADKISVNSQAVKNPYLIRDAAEVFGSQCVVISIDAKRNEKGSWDVYIKGGRENTGWDAIEWAVRAQGLGAGELCINSIDQDGVKTGFDLDLIKRLSEVLNIPIIASGGAGKKEHFLDVFNSGADAGLAASIFHYNEIPIGELKEYLYENNIAVRR